MIIPPYSKLLDYKSHVLFLTDMLNIPYGWWALPMSWWFLTMYVILLKSFFQR